MKSRLARDSLDRQRVAGQKKPAPLRAMPSVQLDVFSFLRSRQHRGLVRINAKIDNVEVAADAQAQFLHRFDQAVVDERA